LTYTSPTQGFMALFGFTAVSALYAVLLLLAISQPEGWFAEWLKAPFFRHFGRISYAIYILHQGCRGIVDALVPGWTPRVNSLRVVTVILLSLLVTMALSELSWRFMESKLIKRAHAQYRY
jgi:peptidoglycan/LPS O-acetylase OafA/YrhL